MPTDEAIISLQHVSKSFAEPGGGAQPVLDDINLDIHTGDFVALLGRSGCGKSTLLRIIAGLIAPSAGKVYYHGAELTGENAGTAMVFQNFALMPWLTVEKNVELGLAAREMPPTEQRTRAAEAIEMIGLAGFESAYPKELSGGMRQRVGFARALVLQPDLLLMDEPFSALDVLTAENLRTQLIKLWAGKNFPTHAICIVTHNIEEAVLLADRVIVLGGIPSHILAEVPIDMERPRDRRSAEFDAIVDKLYALLTGTGGAVAQTAAESVEATPTSHPLPKATVSGLSGLVELLHSHGGHADVADIADNLLIESKDLLPLVDAAALLDFVQISDGHIELTSTGKEFATADIQASKRIFAQQAGTRAPLVRTICRALRASEDGTMRGGFFLDILEQEFTPKEARRQLSTAIGWGRYAELFDYDIHADEIKAGPALATGTFAPVARSSGSADSGEARSASEGR
ncbi:MAG TPA: nitrate/sulfonate/bicarbonate ABC transporter ATP-binding protein [Mycobacterium sp.]|nr:nitrate/sulfonate/bicarbonate ABC transporter ATP-binding protein [Mycobacterium sp.]